MVWYGGGRMVWPYDIPDHAYGTMVGGSSFRAVTEPYHTTTLDGCGRPHAPIVCLASEPKPRPHAVQSLRRENAAAGPFFHLISVLPI